jgi:hypothetical protein
MKGIDKALWAFRISGYALAFFSSMFVHILTGNGLIGFVVGVVLAVTVYLTLMKLGEAL